MTSAAAASRFDITAPIPPGVTVLEASAGTGKTYTIAALAARYVADGLPLERVLLVTFTRNATGELRERVRERLVRTERALEHVIAGGPPDTDELIAFLTAADEDELRRRHERLARAVSDFDAATIATTHGFCEEVLGGLGIAADLAPATTFVEDPSDLIAEVVDDLYVRRFAREEEKGPPFRRDQALKIARAAILNPDAPLAPADGDVPEMRRRLAEAARGEFERRKLRRSVLTFDDLLGRLDAALCSAAGAATASRLRTRFDVALVDEFQDTDPVQWRIMRRAFAETGATLIVIGDPKQAIYAFRGADVYAYLEASRHAGGRADLQVNWRSDQGLLDAYDVLFGDTRLGHEGIVYRRVRAADAHQRPRLHGAPVEAPLRIRVVPRENVKLTPAGYASAPPAREYVAEDLALDVAALLSSGAGVESRQEDGTTVAEEPIRAAHVAVLVGTNREAAEVREALDAVNVPAVINGAGSVFATEPAREWLHLLEALERPSSAARAHTTALSCFLGWPAGRVACADEAEWESVHRRLQDWARVFRNRGVASLLETITLAERLPERILSAPDGERRLTDLRHVGQLLHAAATAEGLGTTALTAWLRRRIADADDDTTNEDRSRRLDSDAEAVQVLTIHRSKGLEFPVVYAPYVWQRKWIPDGEPVVFHDPDAGDARTVDVAMEGTQFGRNVRRNRTEERGEELRLLYVALTRARHQAVLWWAGSFDSRDSPLSRLVFEQGDDGAVPATGSFTPGDGEATARFEELAAATAGRISVERAQPALADAPEEPAPEAADLDVAPFDRGLDRRWRRTSFSDIAAGTHETRVASEPEEGAVSDEPDEPEALSETTPPVDAALQGPSLLGEMPSGIRVGTLVHRVLEEVDFAAEGLESELTDRIAAAQAWRKIDIGDPARVVAGLRAAIETPLGPLLGDLRLRDVHRADRLDELEFELPLAGGEDPRGWLTTTAIGDLLREHLGPDDPLATYAARLDDETLRNQVRGYLTGSLDLVIRFAKAGEPRFAVVDYKTNWLGDADEVLTVGHHRPELLAAEMGRRHYGLQALLYTVALHRYLRWRVAGYEPDRHLAGVLYLFLRGMIGPDTPRRDGVPCGVFGWRPPGALVEALSELFDQGVAA